MSIQHSGGTIIDTTFTGATKANIADGIKAALVSAGWSVASGSSGDWKLDSAISAQGLQMRVRLWDGVAAPTSANCAQIRIMNVAETTAPAGSAFLLPGAAKTFRVIANRYQAFVFVPGSYAAREFAAFGLPYLPAHIASPAAGYIYEAGWLTGNAQSDTDTTYQTGFQTELFTQNGTMAVFCNGNAWAGTSNSDPGRLRLMAPPLDSQLLADNFVQWHDGSYLLSDAIIGWGLTAYTNPSQGRGQLWGAFVDSAARTGYTEFAFNDGSGSHNFIVITNANTGTTRGTLCVAIN